MDAIPADAGPVPEDETEAERRSRIAWEAKRVAEADASFAAGAFATSAEVKAWIDSIGTDRPLPPPYSGRSRPL